MRILLLENSQAIERVVKLGLGSFPEAELQTCQADQDVAELLTAKNPELVVISDGFLDSGLGVASDADRTAWQRALESIPKDRLVMLASSTESAERLRSQGYSHVLRKPFKMSEFREIVQPVWMTSRSGAGTKVTAPAASTTLPRSSLPKVEAHKPTMPAVTMDLAGLEAATTVVRGVRADAPQPARSADSVEVIVDKILGAKFSQLEAKVRSSAGQETEDRVLKLTHSAVGSEVEAFLNKAWPQAVKSLNNQVKNAVLQDYQARLATDMEQLSQKMLIELKSVVRQECEEALRSWMGSFSRDVLKEVAREELQRLIGGT
jgi:hypothetical protein